MTDRHVPIAEVMPGVTMDLAETDIVMHAVCIAVIAPMEGDDRRPSIYIANTGIDWITQRGILHIALDIERGIGDIVNTDDQDDT